MNDRLTPEAETQLRALARKISVSNELAPDLQEELYGHLEDKTLGYLSGEEAVSVDDAVLLTREHFGDPRMLKSWLSSVHTREAAIGTGRRLAALAILMLTIGIAVKALDSLSDVAILHCVLLSSAMRYVFIYNYVPFALVGLAGSLWIAQRWRECETHGETPWYARWSGHRLGIVILLLLAGQWAIPWIWADKSLTAALGQAKTPWYISVFLPLLLNLPWPMLWLWWADRPPYRLRTCACGLGSYVLLRMASDVSRMLAGIPTIVMGGSESWHFEIEAGVYFLPPGGDWILSMTHAIWTIGIRLAEVSAAALVLYAIVRMAQHVVRSRTQRPA